MDPAPSPDPAILTCLDERLKGWLFRGEMSHALQQTDALIAELQAASAPMGDLGYAYLLRGRALTDAERYDEGVVAVDEARRLLGPEGAGWTLAYASSLKSAARLQYLLAEARDTLEPLDTARQLLEDAVALVGQAQGPEAPQLVALYTDLGLVALKQEALETAGEHLNRAEAVIESAGIGDSRAIRLSLARFDLAWALKDYEGALTHAQRALNLARAQENGDPADLTLALHTMAHVYMNRPDRSYEEAIPYSREASKQCQALPERCEPSLSWSLDYHIGVASKLGHLQEC